MTFYGDVNFEAVGSGSPLNLTSSFLKFACCTSCKLFLILIPMTFYGDVNFEAVGSGSPLNLTSSFLKFACCTSCKLFLILIPPQ